jgi:serine phosphatase RsbU (regulator of sigma subunit)
MQNIFQTNTSNHAPLTLLCVENNLDTQKLYKSIFKDMFENIIFVKKDDAAFEVFLEEEVDLFITSSVDENTEAFKIIEQIRQIDMETPIVLATPLENTKTVIEALGLGINNLFNIPLQEQKIKTSIQNMTKLIKFNKYIKKQKKQTIETLQDKSDYNNYQENLALEKEMKLIRNDFVDEILDSSKASYKIDVIYNPLDIVSGDAYSIRKTNQEQAFVFIADGMGKGLSASLSAMLITSYVNHLIDISKEMDFKDIIEKSVAYIAPILLDYEALSAEFILVDNVAENMSYAKFSMPASLLLKTDNKIQKIKSNNPPISPYTTKVKIDTKDIHETKKFLFFTDGMVENTLVDKNESYDKHVQTDFINTSDKDGFRQAFLDKINTQEDDITCVYISKI